VLRYIGAEEALYPLGNINTKYKGERKNLGKQNICLVWYLGFHKQPNEPSRRLG
jgi:hypothetical protein